MEKFTRPNLLGDLRAESDRKMLSEAFLETADYRTLIETSDRSVVVGRRGTGKSALAYKIEKYWTHAENVSVLKVAPEEYHVLGLRPLIELFGDTFSKMRAASRLAWRYTLMMEIVRALSKHASFSAANCFRTLEPHLEKWGKSDDHIVRRFHLLLKESVSSDSSPEERISELPVKFDLSKVEHALEEACGQSNGSVVFLIDKLDEGYEPDSTGIALVDGLVQASIDIKTKIPNIRPVTFLRDNIFRAVQQLDPDYSRNIEGHVLRLHWDEKALFDFATRRMRNALQIEAESSEKIWNSCTASDARGRSGFSKCLQMTLYRPRDVVSLLNEAFYSAGKSGQTALAMAHVKSTAKGISQNRLEDLKKEYVRILPGLPEYISAFEGKSPEREIRDVSDDIEERLSKGSNDPRVQQDFFILEDARAVLRGLYSIGFIGVKERSAGTFVFCHDGRSPDREFSDFDQILVHPCYWMALNCIRNALDVDEAEEIYDEYDIEVSSETPAIRNNKIRHLVAKLDEIPEGAEGADDFETWCHQAIRICFAKGLTNVELKPNSLAKSRRDVVATNLGSGDVWERIYNDYETRHVTFEIKNYASVEAADFQQVQSYLSRGYGKLGFIVNREDSIDLKKGKDIEWVREEYLEHRVVIIKLTGRFLAKLLEKLINPQKHDAVNVQLHKLLDTYERLYIAGQAKSGERGEGKAQRRRSRRTRR